MLETGLAAAFGFCAALFLVLLIAPPVVRRVSELTWRHATRVLPQSSEEIAAAHDALRGQNAVEIRHIESKLEAVAEKERLLQIGRQALEDRISALSQEANVSKDTISKLQTNLANTTHELQSALETNALLSTESADKDVRFLTLEAEFASLRQQNARQAAALGVTEEAHRQAQNRVDVTRNEAAALRSKLAVAESELRMARSAAKRYESDGKLAGRKITALEGKLERSIRIMAEAEEKLERREAELKRYKERVSAGAPVRPLSLNAAPAAAITNGRDPRSAAIHAQIETLRPLLRKAAQANPDEQARIKAEMMDIAGRVTAEAARQKPGLKAKITALQPGGALDNAILKHSKNPTNDLTK